MDTLSVRIYDAKLYDFLDFLRFSLLLCDITPVKEICGKTIMKEMFSNLH